jgi:5-hydroxyisourate hydrolase
VGTLSTHVLYTSRGVPAAGVPVTLETGDGRELGSATTDADGRVGTIGPDRLDRGVYRLRFDTAAYFAATGGAGFYPDVTISFAIADAEQHYHVPLLLNPFGYSTYRGS